MLKFKTEDGLRLDPNLPFRWPCKTQQRTLDTLTMTWTEQVLSRIIETPIKHSRISESILPSCTWTSRSLSFQFKQSSTIGQYAVFYWCEDDTVILISDPDFCGYFKACIDGVFRTGNGSQLPLPNQVMIAERGEELFALMDAMREEFLFRALPAAIRAYEAQQNEYFSAAIAAEQVGRWLASLPLLFNEPHGPISKFFSCRAYLAEFTQPGHHLRLSVQSAPSLFCVDYVQSTGECIALVEVSWNFAMGVEILWVKSLQESLFQHLRAQSGFSSSRHEPKLSV